MQHVWQDFRNCFNTLNRLILWIPQNPYILSRMGRFYLEIGKRAEAL